MGNGRLTSFVMVGGDDEEDDGCGEQRFCYRVVQGAEQQVLFLQAQGEHHHTRQNEEGGCSAHPHNSLQIGQKTSLI